MSVAPAKPPVVPADARPVVVADGGVHLLEGGRCRACGHALVLRRPRCTRCGGEVDAARFGPAGTIWASTVVHVPAREGDEVPSTLAYVDLDDGPRLLARIDERAGLARVGARVALAPTSATGNPVATVVA